MFLAAGVYSFSLEAPLFSLFFAAQRERQVVSPHYFPVVKDSGEKLYENLFVNPPAVFLQRKEKPQKEETALEKNPG